MKKTISSLLLWAVFSAAPLYAGELTYTLILYRSSFTTPAYNAVKAYGYANNQQPVKITTPIVGFNTNLIKINVTPQTQVQTDFINNLAGTGKGFIVRTTKIVWLNGQVNTEVIDYNPIPPDFATPFP